MPIRAANAEQGDFVYRPKSPVNREFAEYLDSIDALLTRLGELQNALESQPFSADLTERKSRLDRELGEFIAPYRGVLTRGSVEQVPALLPVFEFFEQYRPIEEPFCVLHCTLDMPLHTVARFSGRDELDQVNAALAERTPLRWWRDSPLGRPCFLFGQAVWEVKPGELTASDDGLALLLIEEVERQRHRLDGLRSRTGAGFGAREEKGVSEEVRLAVWRRDRGRCAKCGSRQTLDFQHIVRLDRGGDDLPENVQLLCEACRHAAAASP